MALLLNQFLSTYPGTWDRVKLVRHQDGRYPIKQLSRANQVDIYQGNQGSPVFEKCRSILSFQGEAGTRAIFHGFYHVDGCEVDDQRPWPDDFIFRHHQPGRHWYALRKDPLLQDLEGRLVIDWGKANRSWHQWLHTVEPKEIVEVRARGRFQPFAGYDELVISYEDLRQLAQHPEANLDWRFALSKISGVYLIQDCITGNQYIGSAYGKDGIWGRWMAYVDTRHGNNHALRVLLAKHTDRHLQFRFSILKTLPLSYDKDKVISYESIFKEKLGSRAFGLNMN